METIKTYIDNIIKNANMIGNYSGYYAQKSAILENAYNLKTVLEIKDNIKPMTQEEIEKELGYKIKIIN